MNKFLPVLLITLLATVLSAASFYILRTIYSPPGPEIQYEHIPDSPANVTGEEQVAQPQYELPASPQPPDVSENAREMFNVYEQGVRSLENGQFRDAIQSFQQVKDHFPDAVLGLGFAYFSLKEYREAKLWLESSLEMNDSLICRKLLSRIEYMDNNLQTAFDHAKAGLSIKEDPDLRRFFEQIKKELAVQENYIKEVTSHFDFYYDGYEQRDTGRTVAKILEEAYSDIGRDLGYFPDSSIQVIMYVNRDFHEVTHAPSWTGGLFDGKIRVPLKGAGNDLSLLKRVLYHEYTHALVFSLTSACPVWLNEGLAEYFGNGPAPSLEQKLPLDTLDKPFVSLPSNSARSAYRSSHSAVTKLIDRFGMYRIKDLLIKLSEGLSFDKAFSLVYPVSFPVFQNQWADDSKTLFIDPLN